MNTKKVCAIFMTTMLLLRASCGSSSPGMNAGENTTGTPAGGSETSQNKGITVRVIKAADWWLTAVKNDLVFKIENNNGEMKLHRSTDGGATFAVLQTPDNDGSRLSAQAINLTEEGTLIWARFFSKRDGFCNMKMYRSTDNGDSFTSADLMDGDKCASMDMVSQILRWSGGRDGTPLYLFTQVRADNGCQTWFFKSSDDGISFAGKHKATDMCADSRLDGASGDNVFLFNDYSDQNELFVSRDGGESFERGVEPYYQLCESMDKCFFGCPVLRLDGDNVYIEAIKVTQDWSLEGLYLFRSEDGGQTFSTPIPVASGNEMSISPFVARAGKVYSIYADRIYASLDDGRTFSELDLGNDSIVPQGVAIGDTNGELLYVFTN